MVFLSGIADFLLLAFVNWLAAVTLAASYYSRELADQRGGASRLENKLKDDDHSAPANYIIQRPAKLPVEQHDRPTDDAPKM